MPGARNPSPDKRGRPAVWKEKIRILYGCILHPLHSHRWLRFLRTHPVLREVVKSPIALLRKIHQPWLSTRLDCSERVDLLIGHYNALFHAGFAPLLRQAAQKPLTLCTFFGKTGTPYALQLSAMEQDRQDGELLLRLVSGSTVIYAIACVIIRSEGGTSLKAGGLHGMLSTGRGTGIKQITRDLYGCRPKDLMVLLARDLGRCFGCSSTVLTGNDNRLPDTAMRVCRKSADWNRTWKELRATPREDGDYELPCPAVEDALERARCTSSPRNLLTPTRRSVLIEVIHAAMRANIMARRVTTGYMSAAAARSIAGAETLERSHT